MSSARTVEIVGSNLRRVKIVCEPNGPYWLGNRGEIHGLSPYEITSRRVGNVPGERLENVRAVARLFAVPLLVQASSEQEVDDYLADLGGLLSPRMGPCRIIWTRPDGTAREIAEAYYASGGDRVVVETLEKRWIRVPLIFRAPWPFWRSTTDTDPVVGPAQFSEGFFSGVDAIEIDNVGDVPVFPRFRFTAPVENIEVSSLNQGKMFRISERLPTEQVDIDTDPRSFQVHLNHADAYDAIVDPASEFFELEPGLNRLFVRAVGELDNTPTPTGNIGTYQIWWRPLFETC